MEKKIFRQLFGKELGIAIGRLEDAKKVENYCKSIGEAGERYRYAKCNRIKYEKLVECLEELIDLPLVHEIRFASDKKLDSLREEHLREFKKKEYSTEVAIDDIKAEIKKLEAKEKENFDEPDRETKERKGKEVNEEIYRKKEKLKENRNKLGNIRRQIKEIEELSYPALRSLLIDIIPNSDSIVGRETYALSKESDYKLFEKVAENPTEVEKLVELIKNLIHEIGTYNPNAFKYDINKVDSLDIPERLKEDVFDNSMIYSIVDYSFDPELAYSEIKSFNSSFKDDKKRFECFCELFNIVSGYLQKLKLVEKQLDLDPDFIDLNEIFLTPEQTDILYIFSKSYYNDLKKFFDCLGKFDSNITKEYEEVVNEVDLIKDLDEQLKRLKGKLFKGKKRDSIRRDICSIQIDIFKEIKRILQRFFIDRIEYIDLQKRIDVYINHSDIYSLSETKETVDTYSKNIDSFQKEVEELRRIDKVTKDNIKRILESTGCKEVDKSSLLVEDSYESIVDHIYECAALCEVCRTIRVSEYAAKCLAFEEEAELRNMSLSEFGVKKIEEEREFISDSYEKILAFNNKKINSLSYDDLND